MKIVNVTLNGSKGYGPGLCDWLHRRRPDIVTLQKVGPAKHLPTVSLRDIGYESKYHAEIPRSHLGIAVLSRRSLPSPHVLYRDLPDLYQSECRFLTVEIGGLWVSSVYAPYGPLNFDPNAPESKPEQAVAQRVEWLRRLRDHVRDKDYANRDSVLCGDFNVKVRADGPFKWHDPHYSDKDRDAYEEVLSVGFVDLYRKAHPDYRAMPGCTHGYSDKFPDGTSRLHLVLASRSLSRRLRSVHVDVESRPWPRMDSPPVIGEFEFAR